MFADDTTVFYSDKCNPNTENILNNELTKVSNWLIANKLSLNVDKSTFLHFYKGKKKLQPIKVLINNLPVEEKAFTKYLGTLIDNKLNWKKHIHYVTIKLSKAIGILSKIRYYTPKHVLINLYYSFIQSHLNYGLLNWSSTATTNLECIRLKLRKAIRIITFRNKYEHSKPLFKDLKILPLDSLIKHKQAVFMWKRLNGFLQSPVANMFTQKINSNKFYLPSPDTNYKMHYISYSCPKNWNIEVPSDITHLKNFTKTYKTYLLNIL